MNLVGLHGSVEQGVSGNDLDPGETTKNGDGCMLLDPGVCRLLVGEGPRRVHVGSPCNHLVTTRERVDEGTGGKLEEEHVEVLGRGG